MVREKALSLAAPFFLVVGYRKCGILKYWHSMDASMWRDLWLLILMIDGFYIVIY